MSRRKKDTRISDGLPPSHPMENNADHRQFLLRSIQRNDVDTAAILEINRALEKCKNEIKQVCGEETLLDLGLGNIQLFGDPGEETLVGDKLPQLGQGHCIEFLLHMKLRRRLLNRLARRLHRVAHAMDGEDVQPPIPPKYGELPLHLDPEAVRAFAKDLERREEARKTLEAKIQAESDPTIHNENALDVDYKAFIDYKDGYEKRVTKMDDQTEKVHYVMLDQERQEDYEILKDSSGIGAVSKHMTEKDKAAELNRWKTSILSKIPDQPTFQELGLEHRVFALEERRKRIRDEALSRDPSKKLKTEGNGDDDDDDDVDDEFSPHPEGDEEGSESAPSKKEDQNEQKEDSDKADIGNIIVKPISLMPVPSFYEQDSRRTRLIHMNLISNSLQNHVRRRIEDSIKEYNKALAASVSAKDALQAIQTRLNTFLYENRGKLASPDEQYAHDVESAKRLWNKKRKDYEHIKLDRCLPSRWGRVPEGTLLTKSYASRQHALYPQIATCVADIVDAVASDSVKFIEKFEPFVPPQKSNFVDYVVDQNTGELLTQRNQRLLKEMKKEGEDLRADVMRREEERHKAWRKMLKCKSEYNIPHITARGRVPLTIHNYMQVPMPGLQESRPEIVPRIVMPSSKVPSYIPTSSKARQPYGQSESKYSAARIRERTGEDGSMAPVSEPKRDSNGLFMKPPGRGRKGMNWDPHRGIWVALSDEN